jgi:type IV pilus assembly protein PilE
LLITVVVVAVLMAVALPSYQEHLRKGRRAAAEAHLMDISQREQQYFHDVRGYAANVATLNMSTPLDVSKFYTIAIATTAGPPPTFTATATPNVGTGQEFDLGGSVLSIDNGGIKLPAGAW